jgi:hypothetical protein
MCYDPVTASTVVIAVATCANVIVAFYQWRAAKKSAEVALQVFETANRPYVGVFGFAFGLEKLGQTASLRIVFRNFGTVPAENSSLNWDVYLNGAIQTNTKVPSNPSTIYPQVDQSLSGTFDPHTFYAIMSGSTTMEIVVHVTYQWHTDRKDEYSERQRYDPAQKAFMNLGIVPRDKEQRK